MSCSLFERSAQDKFYEEDGEQNAHHRRKEKDPAVVVRHPKHIYLNYMNDCLKKDSQKSGPKCNQYRRYQKEATVGQLPVQITQGYLNPLTEFHNGECNQPHAIEGDGHKKT